MLKVKSGKLSEPTIKEIPKQFPKIDQKDVKSSVANDISELLSYGYNDYSDLKIYVDNHEFQANKAILAARSPVFKNMLKLNIFKEGTNHGLTIEDTDANTFSVFLNFIYTGEVDLVERFVDDEITFVGINDENQNDGRILNLIVDLLKLVNLT